jgi:hypothetical protein
MAKPPPTFDSSINGRTAMIVGGNAQRMLNSSDYCP